MISLQYGIKFNHPICKGIQRKRYLSFWALFLLNAWISAAPSDTIPSWLDTTAPSLTIQPKTKFHSSVFHVILSANEHSLIFYSVNNKDQMKEYHRPFSITRDGNYTIFYYGEDDYGNRSKFDSSLFILDTKSPSLEITPASGFYTDPVTLQIKINEPGTLYYIKDKKDPPIKTIADSMEIKTSFEGYILAIDSAGNRALSEKLNYSIDTAVSFPEIDPKGGIFNHPQSLTFKVQPGVDAFYTFDPLAPPKWFIKYKEPLSLPGGLAILRYYGRDAHGRESEVLKATFVLDTIPPKLHMRAGKGENTDTLLVYSKEKSAIRYTLDNTSPSVESPNFPDKLLIPHRGKCVFKARAWDEAGNASDILDWLCIYDRIPPVVTISPQGGLFTKAQKVFFTSNEPAKILYTLDGSDAGPNSSLYNNDGITITKEDTTIVHYIGIDEAGNISSQKSTWFFLDTRPPQVRVKIEENYIDSIFKIILSSNKPSTIYYETDGVTPGLSSPVYLAPFTMKSGQILKYMAIDRMGNRSSVGTMDELRRPLITAIPRGGIYNRKVGITFQSNLRGTVHYRFLPDTLFKIKKDSLILLSEGNYNLEYYMESSEGLRSVIRRDDYYLDWSPPHVDVSLKKGDNDSLITFFNCTENATVYYTIDGTNPAYSSSTMTAGNKYLQSTDRISFLRKKDIKLAFFAEDLAGNQSAISIIDVMRPRAVPNVPSGPGKIYDRILSISLSTYDQSAIYYERHGEIPTLKSPLFSEPITLRASDTIIAFVIDASGYKGDLDTFIYRIDLPPSPQFKISSDSTICGEKVVFNASGTVDMESSSDELLFRWDFDGDGKFDDAPAQHNKTVEHNYDSAGLYKPVLEVTDPLGRKSVVSKKIAVFKKCPRDMSAVIDGKGRGFCIDKYEWPNLYGSQPESNVTWVEAKMSCIDAGKRLCTAEEWVAACKGASTMHYPYGEHYKKGICPSEGKAPWKSGIFPKCASADVFDMVGNVWEWVEDKDGDYPVQTGGSYKYGKDAHCELKTRGSITSRSPETGFRCCR